MLTTHPRHAAELADQALGENCELVVAVGGDGTLNEVASQLVHTSATLGLIPCGSGDGLGRHLGIHGSVKHALHVLGTGQPRLIDSGLADGHPFFTAAGVGFEAEVSTQFNRLTNRGFLRYLLTSERLWRLYVPEDYHIEQRGERIAVRAFTLTVANSDQYGNRAFIAAGAKVDDGELNLTAVPPVTPWNGLGLLTRLFAGSLREGKGVIQLHGDRFVVERSSAGPLHTDGEVHHAGTRIEFVVRPQSLRIMTPSRPAQTN
ncbi:MAG: diacylglycerol kinase catalytic region [Verrucomicrobia bacterium]|nr:diacylglycerol kinase catalytic region [Verrucomicrobiota bacterium]